ncbi:MAG: leucine-rich repeat domain-containing protein [Paludibacteraceae bacterium]|nr:leucine-rich repeat domain-containing protein [Paludibacteraceae bacterium]
MNNFHLATKFHIKRVLTFLLPLVSTMVSAQEVIDQTLYIADGTTKIQAAAYRNDSTFTSIIFSSSVKEIGQNAFRGCKNLRYVSIPANVETIGAYAFRECPQLDSVYIEEGVKYVKDQAFNLCDNLRVAILPASIETVEGRMFSLKDAVLHCPENSYIKQWALDYGYIVAGTIFIADSVL